jgi:tetratricopeptide (TPR) repeat protein
MAEDSGEVSLSADHDVIVSGDVVGRDKITVINNYIQQQVITPAPTDGEDTPPGAGQAPYKGLQYFDEADAEAFFGREALTAKVIGRLSQVQFLTVIGASGSGKSSLVRAGVIPTLRKGQRLADGSLPPAGSGQWEIRTLTPTAHPLESLAVTLARDEESVTAAATLARDLAAEPRALALAAQRVISRNGKSQLLLFIDQFEEIFTLCKHPAERETFISQILATSHQSSVIILIALRADFYAQCAQHDGLREVVSQQQEYIGAMSQAELARAILEPAKRGRWQIQAGLVEQILDEVGGEPGALPLLSHALLETWLRRRGRTLTLSGYREAGGVEGAIAKTAESVFQQRLTPAQQPIARAIFLRLTELGETEASPDTRRRVPFSELMTRSTDTATLDAVLAVLTEARLVITDKDEVEVAHEALIREWPTLRGWLAENRDGLLRQRALTEDANEWEKLGRDPGVLYRGAKLKQMADGAARFGEPLSALESEFLQASRENAEREAAAARESAGAAQRQRLLTVVAVTLGLLVVAAIVFFALQPTTPRTPATMDRAFNIAVAQFGSGDDGMLLSQWAAERLTFEFQDDPNILVWVDSDALKREKNVTLGVIPESETPAQMAERVNADLVVYGTVTPQANGFAELQLKFYVAPQLNRDLGAVAGEYQLAEPLTFTANNPGIEVKAALGDQAGGVAQISLGLTYELLSRSEEALRSFEKAATAWPDSEIVQFLLGQEHLFRAQKFSTNPNRTVEEVLRETDLAQLALEESIQLNPEYARARIALGSAYTFRAQLEIIRNPIPDDCAGGQPDVYEPLLPLLEQAADNYSKVTLQVFDPQAYGAPLDSIAQLGLGQVQQLRAVIQCGLGDPSQARQLIQLAIQADQASLPALEAAREYRLLAQTYQTLGTAYEYHGYLGGGAAEYRKAIGAYEQCIAQGERFPVDSFLRDEVIGKLCVPYRDALLPVYGGSE